MPPIARSRLAPPKATAMIEALRGLGYSTATALADIIDNSISASARSVNVEFAWDGDASRITVLDDGHGMDEQELDLAMRLGERNPLRSLSRRSWPVRPRPEDGVILPMPLPDRGQSKRNERRLSAMGPRRSRRQRRTTAGIFSKGRAGFRRSPRAAGGRPGHACHVGTPRPGSSRRASRSRTFSISLIASNAISRWCFIATLRASGHALRLTINGTAVKPWDPFLLSASGHMVLARSNGSVSLLTLIEVQCHVLPHKDHLTPQPASRRRARTAGRRNRASTSIATPACSSPEAGSASGRDAHGPKRKLIALPASASTFRTPSIGTGKSTSANPWPASRRRPHEAHAARRRYAPAGARRFRSSRADRPHPYLQSKSPRLGGPSTFAAACAIASIEPHPAVTAVLDDAGGPLAARSGRCCGSSRRPCPSRGYGSTRRKGGRPRATGFAEQPPAEVRGVLEVMYRNLVLPEGLVACPGPRAAAPHGALQRPPGARRRPAR